MEQMKFKLGSLISVLLTKLYSLLRTMIWMELYTLTLRATVSVRQPVPVQYPNELHPRQNAGETH